VKEGKMNTQVGASRRPGSTYKTAT